MDLNYYLDLLRYNIFVQLIVVVLLIVLCVCNIRMCYLNIKKCHAQSGPTHAQDSRTHAQGTIHTIVPDPRTGPIRAKAIFYPEKDEEPESPVYTHTSCPNYNKAPYQIYINDEGNRISHI